MKHSRFLVVLFSMSLQVMAGFNTAGQKGIVRSYSAKTSGKLFMDVGMGINIGQSHEYVSGPLINGSLNGDVLGRDSLPISESFRDLGRQLSANIYMGLGIFSFWDVAVSFPVYYDMLGFKDVQDGGFGDIEISTKLLYPAPTKRLFYQSYFLSTTIPVGMKTQGIFPRHTYYLNNKEINPASNFYSSSYPAFKAMMLWTFDLQSVKENLPLQLHLNMGGVLTTFNQDIRNTVISSLAAEYMPVDYLTLYTELHLESRISSFSGGRNPFRDPFYITPGIKFKTPNGSFLSLGVDFSLSSHDESDRLNWAPKNGVASGYQYSTDVVPRYAIQFQFGWGGYLTAQDEDKDGLKDNEDDCPQVPEDIDGYQDTDGCPDPDNDKDGILDTLDKCPNEPEDKDGFADEDGCPDLDNDGDGVPDAKDLCPDKPEDFDNFEDHDGCPDLDNDKDGVEDSGDRCPNQAEDIDGFEDTDGCPDLDNDKDGIPDLKDQCPNEPEVFNGVDDQDGCPDSVKKEINMPRQQILNGVMFRSGTAELTFDSYQYIDPLVRTLKQYPEVDIEIRGHTEGIGDPGANMKLSQARADAVKQYLISKEIASDRIRTQGMGSNVPIADNKTAAGRAQNRRIEILRLK